MDYASLVLFVVKRVLHRSRVIGEWVRPTWWEAPE